MIPFSVTLFGGVFNGLDGGGGSLGVGCNSNRDTTTTTANLEDDGVVLRV